MTDASSSPERRGMVVGLDGTDASQAAPDWAATRPAQFGPLPPVPSWDVTVAGRTPPPPHLS